MINPIEIHDEDNQEIEFSLDIESLQDVEFYSDYEDEEPKTKRKKRSTKKKTLSTKPEDMFEAEESNRELGYLESNKSYKESYAEGENLLRGSIIQIDKLQNDINEQLALIKSSKTLKRKYDYITNLTSASGALISTRVGAIKELNKIVTDSHNLEMKRNKDLMLSAQGQKDDNKAIMDMYNAFIATPMSANKASFNQMAIPSITDLTFREGSNTQPFSMAVAAEEAPLSNAANMMRLEHNPDVETVVVYDAATGNTWFDVINTKTMQSVEHADKPDPMFLEDTKIDIRNGIARNTNLDLTYKLITINQDNNGLFEY